MTEAAALWRRAVRAIAWLSGVMGGVGLVILFLLVCISILSRPLGVYVRGIDSIAGYAMAISGFGGLAYALYHDEHVRVTLLVQSLAPAAQRWMERLVTGGAVVLTGVLAWYCIRLCWLSWYIRDIATTMDRWPLWIPQSGMATGAVLLFLVMLDRLLCEIGLMPREPGANGASGMTGH